MSHSVEPSISVRVDPTNPGQFFACCGLLELADRLWHGAEGWFKNSAFHFRPVSDDDPGERSLSYLIRAIAAAPLQPLDAENETSSPLEILAPFHLRLDWWEDERADGKQLIVWAGRMSSFRIARAMQAIMGWEELQNGALLDYATIVYDPAEPAKKVEPFYFDARRGSSALPIDIDFSPDSLQMRNLAYPAVEFLCFVGLQRFRPAITHRRRVFEYCTWAIPLITEIAPIAVCGLLDIAGTRAFRFENIFRTDQKKHKAFTKLIH